MTTMESDSASQDSDDGRRFRFEATRKDSAALVGTTSKVRSPKKKSKHKSFRYESSRHHHREKKERSKHEGDRKGDDNIRHSTKHSKHESRNSRQEDTKNSSKDHKDSRDTSVGFIANDRGSRNSSGGDEKEKSRDSKRQSDRDRSIHLTQRSRERSYERNYHEEQTSSDKHKSRYHERHEGHRSRERSHQSSRIKSSNDDHRSREDHERHDSSRKTSIKEDRSQNSKDYSLPKNVERERSHSEARSCENTKKDSLSAQDCKDLDLSQFDVLSEIDENTSDDREYENRASSPREAKLRDSGDPGLESTTYEARENGEGANKRKREWREELSKVKRRSHDPVSSSRSNPNAVSDSSLGSTSPATILIVKDASTSSEKDKFEKTITRDSELSGLEGKSCSDAFSDETRLEKDVEQTESTYGPLLPPRFVSNISDNDEKTSPRTLDGNKVGNEVTDESRKSACFIGPRRSSGSSNRQSEEQEEAKDIDTFATEADVFGPALPPHLLQRQRDDSRDRTIGPVLPDAVKLCKESSAAELSESDEDCGIGPLPVDHPALRNSRVHEKLDLRAQKIRNERYLEEVDTESKREEWMTELPSVQAANLGLGPRKFRVRDGPDMSDRSCWTDMPAQKAQKREDLEMGKKLDNAPEPYKERIEESHKKDTGKIKKREKSLLEMHQSKMAKKKKKKEKEAERTGISTRRPFDRDIDLQVTRLDQTQKKTVLMKAQLLDDRFSRGQI